jgi:hypothetical protein
MSTLAVGLLVWVGFSFGMIFGGWTAWHFATKRLGIWITGGLPVTMRQLADDLEGCTVYIGDDEHEDGKRVQ